MVSPARAPGRVVLQLAVDEPPGGWLLETEDVPETPLHVAIVDLLLEVLRRWLRATGRAGLVTSNLACRWDPSDARVGTDPDVVWVEPSPPEGEDLASLRVWSPGHHPPRLAVEVVSERSAEKDYLEAPARCARLGVEELWVFDPLGVGPGATGGPFPLQVWRGAGSLDSREGAAETEEHERAASALTRIHAGPAPAFSPLLGAWLVTTDGGRRLRIADDPDGERAWPTAAEAEAARAEAQAARAENEAARAKHEAARAENEAARAENEAARAEAEAARADAEAARAAAAEAELARLRARLGASD